MVKTTVLLESSKRCVVRGLAGALTVWFLAGCGSPTSAPAMLDAAPAAGLGKLNHIVIVLLENWSFDSLYAQFAGANGQAYAMAAPPQVDATGAPYATLPQSETHLPQDLPNAPFALDSYIPSTAETSTDLTNNFYEEQRQIHGGSMDRFVLYSSVGKATS